MIDSSIRTTVSLSPDFHCNSRGVMNSAMDRMSRYPEMPALHPRPRSLQQALKAKHQHQRPSDTEEPAGQPGEQQQRKHIARLACRHSRGSGRSKKHAEQEAAKVALDALHPTDASN